MSIDHLAAGIFAVALLHTFLAKQLERLSKRYPRHAGVFHLLGEVEIVFGFWAMVLIAALALAASPQQAVQYAESRNYTEPLFVFVVMVIAASRPLVATVQTLLQGLASAVPVATPLALAWLGLALVPLMGSLITEPAAMTIAALTLAPLVFTPRMPARLKYLALGVLFVNVSIGGTLTAYAAPPVLMVATPWGWDSAFMLQHFAWTVVAVHIVLLACVVLLAHHPVLFIGVFLLFLAYTHAYAQYQSPLILKEALLVGFFLAGLVVLGGLQSWWLQPLVASMAPLTLFFGALGLTAITDNAALTYLGSQIEGMSDSAKYMLMAGAVAGGGLTVIANAPNPAGVALLKHGFSNASISIGGLLLGALAPTSIAALAFLLL